MEFEAIVFALPVVAGRCVTPSDPVPATTYKFADGQHGDIHEAKLRFAL